MIKKELKKINNDESSVYIIYSTDNFFLYDKNDPNKKLIKNVVTKTKSENQYTESAIKIPEDKEKTINNKKK